MMAQLLLTRRDGSTLFVDTSFLACAAFGMRHGDLFVDHHGDKGEVMGVGSGVDAQAHIRVLWVVLEKNRVRAAHQNGYATYYVNRAGNEDASRACLTRHKFTEDVDALLDLFKGFGKSSNP